MAENIFNFTDLKYVNRGEEVMGIETKIDGVTTFVPVDLANMHYAEIMRQVDAGELTIEEAE